MAKHRSDAHRHTKGETDPNKIKDMIDKAQKDNQAIVDKLRAEGK